MTKMYHLVKFAITNFRSIQKLEFNNIGDITIFVGPNESGKTNILKALEWSTSLGPILPEDKPIKKAIPDREVSVELYFKIIDKNQFFSQFKKAIKENCPFNLKDSLKISDKEHLELYPLSKLRKTKKDNKNGVVHEIDEDEFIGAEDISYLKIVKRGDGKVIFSLLDNNMREIKLDSTIEKWILLFLESPKTPIDNKIRNLCEKVVREIGEEKHKLNATQLENLIKAISQNPNYKSFINSLIEKLSFVNVSNDTVRLMDVLNRQNKKPLLPEDYSELRRVFTKRIENIEREIQNTSITVNVSGRSITMTTHEILQKIKPLVLDEILPEIDGFQLLFSALLQLMPKFVYLDQEMELKGIMKKRGGSWFKTFQEYSTNEYVINYRLFNILDGVDIQEFDKLPPSKVKHRIKNALIEFSNTLAKLWSQERIRIDEVNVSESEISLEIVDVDEKNLPIQVTWPEKRSRGFKWYLAYLITIEYLKKQQDTILLLDDPAVFLHEKGQRDFLVALERLSKDIQIMYTTHLPALFDENRLDRVYLIECKVDDNGKYTIKRHPWSSEKDIVMAPIYHALGIDKLIFSNVKNILFTEGISDKFVLEGIKTYYPELSRWYIHPLFGGDGIEDNRIIKKIKMITCLSKYSDRLNHYFILDGDKREKIEREIKDENLKKKIIFLGDVNQELEDIIDHKAYLNCVKEYYTLVFASMPEKLEKLKNVINDIFTGLRDHKSQKITKVIQREFENNNLGYYNKTEVAILLKRKLINKEIPNDAVSIIGETIVSGLEKI